jgi:TatD DNase family protein
MQKKTLRFYDIAANLTDNQFKGFYFGKQRHTPDLEHVLKRSHKFGCSHLLLSTGNLEDLLEAYPMSKKSETYWTTAGVHPCRANEAFVNPEKYFKELDAKIEEYKDKSKQLIISCSNWRVRT